MFITITNMFVEDQAKALAFYTEKLGFQVKADISMGEYRWLTVVSPTAPEGTELLLEPSDHPAVRPYKQALVADGIPAASFGSENIEAEYERLLSLGVTFTQPLTDVGPAKIATFDDTCGNLIQLTQVL